MIQLAVIVVYLLVLLVLGFCANRLLRSTSEDYMLASHSIGPVLLLMSLFGTTMTAFALVGSTGRSYTLGVGVYGLLASASGIVHSACFYFVGVPLWSLGRRLGYKTQIQFFRERLESPWIGLLLFPILVGLVITYLLLGVVASGAVVNQVTQGAFETQGWFAESGHGVPSSLASAVICLVVLTYVFFGGMRGTAWANALQTAVFMVLGMVTFVTIANAMGDSGSLLENMKQATAAVPEANLTRAKIPMPVFFSFLLIPLSVGMFPHVFQHWLTARSVNAFKLSIVLHPIFILIVWVPCVLIGIWASSPNSGIPHGEVSENEVLAMLVQLHAGDVLGGLLTAGILAAIMSSLDSQFLCVGTMFTEDLVKQLGRRQWSDGQLVWISRGFIVLVVAVTYVLSQFPRAVFDLGLWSFSGFTGLFPLVFAALYWKRLTRAGAIASIAATAASWGVLFARAQWGLDKRYAFPESAIPLGIEIPGLGAVIIPPMLPVVTVFAASSLALILVSLATRPPSDQTLAKFFPK